MIQLRVQNQDLFDVDWFLVRLQQTITSSIPDLTTCAHKQPLQGLDQKTTEKINYLFLCVFRTLNMDFSVCSCVHVCPRPWVTGCSLVYCMCSPLCSGELCRAGPNFRLLMCDVFGALAVSEVWCLFLPLGNSCDSLFQLAKASDQSPFPS